MEYCMQIIGKLLRCILNMFTFINFYVYFGLSVLLINLKCIKPCIINTHNTKDYLKWIFIRSVIKIAINDSNQFYDWFERGTANDIIPEINIQWIRI